MEQISPYLSFAIVVIAICAVVLTAVIYWIAKNLISGSNSLTKLLETVDYNVQATVDKLQQSVSDVNKITEEASKQSERVEGLVSDVSSITDDVSHITSDARETINMVNNTVVPILANVHAVVAGAKKAFETWNEIGEQAKAGDSKESGVN
ncbi:MAG TPA: DUF948 domain-containing protein [bacterium]|nr:DUF948 domain-containing protein [bacterium]